MRWISFAWTTPAVCAQRKTVTRRPYDAEYCARFKAGEHLMAVDRRPQYGGQPIAEIRLVEPVTLQPATAAPDSDFEAEGFAYLNDLARSEPHRLGKGVLRELLDGTWSREEFDRWRTVGDVDAVVRFEILRVIVPIERIVGGRVAP